MTPDQTRPVTAAEILEIRQALTAIARRLDQLEPATRPCIAILETREPVPEETIEDLYKMLCGVTEGAPLLIAGWSHEVEVRHDHQGAPTVIILRDRPEAETGA